MAHPDFVVWMLLYIPLMSLSDALRWRFGQKVEYSDGVRGFSALIVIGIWFFIGWKLY